MATDPVLSARAKSEGDIPKLNEPECRFCGTLLRQSFVDLGMSPLSNSYLRPEHLGQMEPYYPLHARVCEKCFLVQLEQIALPENIFGDYAYFSSYSDSWLRHVHAYAEEMIERWQLNARSLVVEIASNDGYLLQYFQAKGIPVLGVEPARNVAQAAEEKGIPTLARFFGTRTSQDLLVLGHQADLIVANNVLAHVPDLRDFVAGLKMLLKPKGIMTLEFPHLLQLIKSGQFDTIYHEHLSYFSFCTAEKILANHGLTVFDVEEFPTHGGSLRLSVCHAGADSRQLHSRVLQLRESETVAGLSVIETYSRFGEKVRETKRALLDVLVEIKRAGKSLAGYGAPAKANTLLNYCGIGRDFLDYTVDISPHKQGLFLPGTHIPILHPDEIRRTRPDYVLILPWNLREEIIEQIADVRKWGGRFVIPIPAAEVIA
ncbi:MAG TPA: class I SAM-dependent methyltransferase [Candidatus Acidoferrales bacterium]|nr:class I SAM-dependent methyltransferase [Candidatus Acidoferrales bacterium]